MNKLVLLTILISLTVAQKPNCHILPGQQDSNVIVMPQEVQVFKLQNFVEGFNLRYEAQGADETSYEVVNPFYATDNKTFPNYLGSDFTFIDFSLETDGNLAWIQRGAFLAKKNSDGTVFVATGSLNSNMNIQINNSVGIAGDGNTTCFNVITLSEEFVLVDCQAKDKQTDVLYIINQTNNYVRPYPFTNSPVTNERKSVALRLIGDRTNLKGGRVFIFSAWIGTGMEDQSQANNTKIEIYYLDKFVPYKVGTITAKNLSLDDLSVSDITVDAIGNMYVSDIRGTVVQFSYDGINLTLGKTWKFSENIVKISADITTNFVNIIQAVGLTQVFEIDLDGYNSQFTYQIPQQQDSKIVDFQTSNDLLIIQTQKFYYVYKRYYTQIDHIIAVFSSNNSRAILAPRSPNAVFVDVKGSTAYLHSEGFFIVKNPKNGINQAVTVVATSVSYNGLPQKKCQFEFTVKAVTNSRDLYYLDDMPSILSYMSSSVRLEFYLNDYFLGSRLQYTALSDSDAEVSLQVQDTIQIISNETFTHADWLGTFEDTLLNYYKVMVVDQKIVVQNCVYQSQSVIQCKTTRTQDFGEKIFKHSFFKTMIDSKTSVPVLAYITESNKRSVNFLALTGDNNYSPLVVDDTFNATDVDVNARYLYVPIKDAKMIRVYKNDFNLTFNQVDTLDSSDIPNADPDFVFFPSETMLSASDINILVVKNVDGILIFRANAFKTEYVSQIPIAHLGFSYISSEIVVGSQTMLVIISDNSTGVDDEIHEFSIYDLSNPFKLRSIDLIDKQLVRPVTALVTKTSSIIGLRTKLDGSEFVTLVQLSRPQVGSVLADISSNGNLLSVVRIADGIVGETIQNSNSGHLMKHLNNQISAIRFYNDPVFIVKANLDNNQFKDTKTYGLSVKSIQRQITLTQTLNLYNVRSSISPSSTTPQKIEFPRNSNAQEMKQAINVDDYFLGPVCKYSLDCPICKEDSIREDDNASITLKDHVTLINTAGEFTDVRAFYYFTDKGILWSVSNNGIFISDDRLNKKGYVEINFGFDARRVDGITPFGGKFVVYVYNEEENVHNLVTISSDDSRINPVVESVIPILNNPGINAVQLIKSLGNRIFILDNKLDTNGKGEVYVITGSNQDGGQKFTYQYTIDSSTFNLASGKINDFELIQLEDNGGFFLASVSNQGIVFGSFDTTDAPFSLYNPKSYSLNTDNNIQSYQISGTSFFLQLEIIAKDVQKSYLHLTTLLTVSNGQHLEFFLNFNKMDNGFEFDSIDIIGQFDKYGQQSVINWAQGLVYESTNDNFILVGHKNSFEVALGLYSLTHKSSSIGHQRMIGAIQSKLDKQLTNNDFSALLFRVNNQMRVVVSGSESKSVELFNLSKNVYITYRYNTQQDFDSIRIIATNAYGSSSRNVEVSFEKNPITPGGLAWYIILVIVLGVLAIVGIGVFLFIKYKKKQGASKDSLLSVSKAEEEDEEI